MEILERLTEECSRRRLGFVVIGGHALIAWGVSRQTADLDLLVPGGWRPGWKDLLRDLGYSAPHERGTFLQYAAPVHGAWPIDLLVVGDDTFERVSAEAAPAQFGGATCPVACPDHLLAMKCHALRYVREPVALKYLADVHGPVRKTGRQLTDPPFATSASSTARRRSMTDSSETRLRIEEDRALLDLPCGEDHVPPERTYTVEQLLELSENRLPLITSHPDFEQERLSSKCPVPFRLLP